jgi:hypothetical protein
MIRYPAWIPKLSATERLRAKAIYVFMQQHTRPFKHPKMRNQFEQLIEDAKWPDSGMFPPVSSKTANKLGINTEEWDAWRTFSKVRGFLRDIKNQLLFKK